MNEPTENLVLELLRSLRNELHGLRQQMQAEFGDVKERLTTVERRFELADE